MKILLGPAGSPARSTLEGIRIVHDLGLHSMEVAFTHGIHMGNELAKRVGKEAEKFDIHLSIHAPYYINLASADRIKLRESRKRILDSCERGHHMGAQRIVFHAAYYGKGSKEETYELVKKEIEEMLTIIEDKKWSVELLPETMGRVSQFGDLDELIKLSKETGCSLCIDPAHIYARNIGKIDFADMFNKLEKTGKKEFHFHFSGIAFGPRGERNHLIMDHNPDFTEFAKEILKRKINATIISESPRSRGRIPSR